jgi:hypothetical protein
MSTNRWDQPAGWPAMFRGRPVVGVGRCKRQSCSSPRFLRNEGLREGSLDRGADRSQPAAGERSDGDLRMSDPHNDTMRSGRRPVPGQESQQNLLKTSILVMYDCLIVQVAAGAPPNTERRSRPAGRPSDDGGPRTGVSLVFRMDIVGPCTGGTEPILVLDEGAIVEVSRRRDPTVGRDRSRDMVEHQRIEQGEVVGRAHGARWYSHQDPCSTLPPRIGTSLCSTSVR